MPAGGTFLPPVADHADLADGEADEDADGEERYERVGVSAGEDQEGGGDRGQGQDSVAVHLAVGLEAEDVGEVVVAGEEAHEDGEAAEGGVRGQGQQDHRRELHDIERPVVAQ